MRAYHAAILAGVLLWQIAPLPGPADDSTGRYRISLAAGTGRWEDAQFDCDGNFVSSQPVPVTSYGARADVMLTPTVRATVSGGAASASEYGATKLHGGFGAGQIALEGRRVGFGLGLSVNPLLEGGGAHPNFYLRLGNANAAHFRADVFEPRETVYLEPLVRVGVGFNTGSVRRIGGFVGLGFGPYYDQASQTVVTGELSVPVGNVDLLLRAQGGPGAGLAQWGLGGGLRFSLR